MLKSQGDGLRQGLALVHLGKARQKLGDSAGAIEAFKAAIQAWRSEGDKAMEATTYLMLGRRWLERTTGKVRSRLTARR